MACVRISISDYSSSNQDVATLHTCREVRITDQEESGTWACTGGQGGSNRDVVGTIFFLLVETFSTPITAEANVFAQSPNTLMSGARGKARYKGRGIGRTELVIRKVKNWMGKRTFCLTDCGVSHHHAEGDDCPRNDINCKHPLLFSYSPLSRNIKYDGRKKLSLHYETGASKRVMRGELRSSQGR